MVRRIQARIRPRGRDPLFQGAIILAPFCVKCIITLKPPLESTLTRKRGEGGWARPCFECGGLGPFSSDNRKATLNLWLCLSQDQLRLPPGGLCLGRRSRESTRGAQSAPLHPAFARNRGGLTLTCRSARRLRFAAEPSAASAYLRQDAHSSLWKSAPFLRRSR